MEPSKGSPPEVDQKVTRGFYYQPQRADVAPTAAANHRATRAWAGVVGPRKRSDVEEANSGSADVEVVVVELGFYDDVTAETYKRGSLI